MNKINRYLASAGFVWALAFPVWNMASAQDFCNNSKTKIDEILRVSDLEECHFVVDKNYLDEVRLENKDLKEKTIEK